MGVASSLFPPGDVRRRCAKDNSIVGGEGLAVDWQFSVDADMGGRAEGKGRGG